LRGAARGGPVGSGTRRADLARALRRALRKRHSHRPPRARRDLRHAARARFRGARGTRRADLQRRLRHHARCRRVDPRARPSGRRPSARGGVLPRSGAPRAPLARARSSAMSEHDDSEKTEEATPERRRRAREEGQFPRSKDAQAVAASLAVLLALTALATEYGTLLSTYTVQHFGEPYALVHGEVGRVFSELGGVVLRLLVPPACIAVAMSLLVGFAEAGIEPRLELVLPKWSRIDPLARLRELLSPKQQAVTGLLTLARVVVIGVVSTLLLRDAFPLLARLTRAELGAAVHEVLAVAMRFSLWATLALAGLAAIDYFQSWLRHERSIRMTKQEIKEEHHQQEGDPRV